MSGRGHKSKGGKSKAPAAQAQTAEQENEAKERQHWFDVMRAFLSYEDFVELGLAKRQEHLRRLPKDLIARLPPVTFSKMGTIRAASKTNQDFFRDLVHFQYNHFYDFPKYPRKTDGHPIPYSQMHRDEAVLHSLVREWGAEGAEERQQCFVPIVQQLLQHLLEPSSPTGSTTVPLNILVPGCGVGRLPVEIAGAHPRFHVQANEFSVYMILASNFMLNGIERRNQYNIHPWVDKVCNVRQALDTSAAVSIPDCLANEIMDGCNRHLYTGGEAPHVSAAAAAAALPPPPPAAEEMMCGECTSPSKNANSLDLPKFSFAAGDFVSLYSIPKHSAQWAGIVTCFFIDTAPVVMEYVQTIHNMLQPGGVWVNMGPLLYHWVAEGGGDNDERYSRSVELSYEEVKHVIIGYGFEFLSEDLNRPCRYASDTRSLMHTQYNTVLFAVRKKA